MDSKSDSNKTEELRSLYEKIYIKSERTRKGWVRYGSDTDRDHMFLNFIQKNLPPSPPIRILDASCGRGHLTRSLQELGYTVEATEISSWVIENCLKDLKVHRLTYDELDRLEEKSFDAVISNDVLEHLPDKNFVLRSLDNLKRLSRKYLLISVGLKRHLTYTEMLGMSGVNLHLFTPGLDWWTKKMAELMTVEKQEHSSINYFCAGRI
jgi:2-polyprenyl-3-methyl-5-hydroxy-6-metoxy-1,4-benzoquinol methylase